MQIQHGKGLFPFIRGRPSSYFMPKLPKEKKLFLLLSERRKELVKTKNKLRKKQKCINKFNFENYGNCMSRMLGRKCLS
jgi:hypothetical protein